MIDWTFGLGAFVASSVGLLYRGQSYLIYMPEYPAGSRTNVRLLFQVAKPTRYGLNNYIELELKCQDSVIIVAYLICQPEIPLSNDSTENLHNSSPSESLTLIYFHANAGNIGHRLPIAAKLYKKSQCNILMVSYRGYGRSQGIPDETGIRLDAQAALDYVLNHPQLSKGKIVLYGQSIGGAVAIDLASRNPTSIHALILENTFLSIPKLVTTLLPIGGQCVGGFCHQIWDSESKMPSLGHLPILFITGTNDELIHSSHMEGLLDTASQVSTPGATKSFVAIPGGTHNDTCTHATYFEAISEFLNRLH